MAGGSAWPALATRLDSNSPFSSPAIRPLVRRGGAYSGQRPVHSAHSARGASKPSRPGWQAAIGRCYPRVTPDHAGSPPGRPARTPVYVCKSSAQPLRLRDQTPKHCDQLRATAGQPMRTDAHPLGAGGNPPAPPARRLVQPTMAQIVPNTPEFATCTRLMTAYPSLLRTHAPARATGDRK